MRWCDKAAINRLWSIGTCCWIDWDHKCCLPTVWTTRAYPTHFCFFLPFTRAQTFQAAVVSQSVCICFLILNHLMALQEMKYELHLEKCPNYWFSSLVFFCTYNESVLIQNQELTCIGQMVWEQREDQADQGLDARSDFSTGFYLPTLPTVLTALPCLPHRLLPISQPPTPIPPHTRSITFSSRCTHRIYIFWQE